ncbi:MAG TPA: hypothetical protein VGD77_06115 [Gemmatimonadaceae bacterium]
MRIPALSFLAALVAAIAAAPAAAQPSYAELQPGARVRLGDAPRRSGTVLTRRGDSITVAVGKGAPRTLALASLTGVQVYRGRSRASGARVGALWGTGLGILFGAVVARGDSAMNEGAFIAFAGYNGLVTGATIGAIAGRERWVTYGAEPPRLTGAAWSRLAPGTRVRVSAPGVLAPDFTGTVLEHGADTLRVSGEGGIPVAIPVAAIATIERSSGRGRGRGALVGAGVGALMLGGIAGLLATSDDGLDAGEATLQGAAGGAFWGLVIGALVGADDWKGVQPVTAWVPGSRQLLIGARISVR